MLTGKMCGMDRTTELSSKLSVAVKEKRCKYKYKYIEYSKVSMSNPDYKQHVGGNVMLCAE